MRIVNRTHVRASLQVWLQLFSWTEKDLPHWIAERASLLKNRAAIEKEPMFCFETAVKLLYWAGLAYEIDEVWLELLYIYLSQCISEHKSGGH